MERYSEYKDSGVKWLGEIPRHWEVLPMKCCVQIKNGMDYKHVIADSGYPVIGSGGQFAYASDYMYDGEVVFFGRKGTIDKPLHYKGKFWVVDTMFYAIPKTILGRFLYYVGLTIPYKYYSTATALPSMTQSDLGNNPICFPPINEQEAIANYLDAATSKIDEAIAQQQKMIDLLNERKQIIINNAVTKGLDPNVPMKDSGAEWIGEIPEHWEVRKLKFLLTDNLMYGANESAESEDESYPRYIRITDIDDEGHLRPETFRSLLPSKAEPYLLKKGDVLFARSGATAGKTYLFTEDIKACFAGYLIKASLKETIKSEFLYYYTKSGIYDNWKKSIFIQATIPNIGADKYANLQITLPSLQEQHDIIQHLDMEVGKILKVIKQRNKQISLLQERKQIIINDVVTGKVKVV